MKGLTETEAQRRVKDWLQRFDLAQHSHKKLKELSKGMQQKAQLISSLVHEPDVVIIDEPFSALDPVNTQMVKDLLRDLRSQNKTIVMCTHQMHQVEELCDRLVLINQGKSMLYGRLVDIQRQYASHDVMLRTKSTLPNLPGMTHVDNFNHESYKIGLIKEITPQLFLKQLLDANVQVDGFEIALPTLDEIFIQVVQNADAVGDIA